jgi:hypothetical protein
MDPVLGCIGPHSGRTGRRGHYLLREHFSYTREINYCLLCLQYLCGIVVRVPGYRSTGPGFDSLLYQIFGEVVGPERGPLSLVSTIEELLGRNSSDFGLENREYGRGDPLR